MPRSHVTVSAARIFVLAVLILALPGCCARLGGFCTTFGYLSRQVPARLEEPPRYPDVRTWALRVANGYDSRHTLNRYMLYGGALTAAAAAGALTGLAA